MQPPRRRSGSVLILALAIVISLTVVAYAFLRVAQMHNEASDSMTRQSLSREAAEMGTQHAIENIMRDFMVSENTAAGTMTPRFTRIDGPARSAFQNINTNSSNIPLSYRPSGDFDISSANIGLFDGESERPATESLYGWSWQGGYSSDGFGTGNTQYDGRGRFYEPNWYNAVVTDGVSTSPTTAVPFGTPASTDPTPTRSNAIFFDEHWRRMSATPSATDRVNARYRLRYTVGVGDLDAAFLLNSDPRWQEQYYANATTTDPAGYDTIAASGATAAQREDGAMNARVLRYQNMMVNLSLAQADLGWGDGAAETIHGFASNFRIEHVFLGRGMAANFAFDASRNPVTWPLMYRQPNNPFYFLEANAGYYQTTGIPSALNIYKTTSGPTTVTGNPAGGETLPTTNQTMRRSLMGPQYSFQNANYAVLGGNGDGMWQQDSMLDCCNSYTPFGRGMFKITGTPTHYQGRVDTPFLINPMTAPTRVIWGAIAGYMPPYAIAAYYHDYSKRPPDWSFSGDPALWGGGKPNAHPNDPRLYTGGSSFSAPLIGKRDVFIPKLSPAFATYLNPTRATPFANSPDYHVGDMRKGTDEGYRSPGDRYPGPICVNGYDDAGVLQHDTLGMYLRSVDGGDAGLLAAWGGPASGPFPDRKEYMQPMNRGMTCSFDPHVGHQVTRNGPMIGFWYYPQLWGGRGGGEAGGAWYWQWDGTQWQPQACSNGAGFPPPAPAGPVPGVAGTPPATPTVTWACNAYRPHPFSVWDAVGQAMGDTIMVARAQWMQYGTFTGDPATIFNGSPWTGPTPSFGGTPNTKVMNIQDLDALFLANLGTNPSNPTSTTPCTVWYPVGGWPRMTIGSYTPTWNIAKLNDAAACPYFADGTYNNQQRTAMLELIVNDMRLSFFGCSPQYADSFRALDLNGDGKVHCSGYIQNAGASGPEKTMHLDQYVSAATAATKVMDNYFANGAVFSMGKSHFWEVIARGEVWDNVTRTCLSESIKDTVLCLDPADKAQEFAGSTTAGDGQYASHVIYSRWFYDKYRGHLSRKY